MPLNLQQLSYAERLQRYASGVRADVQVMWFWGPTGTGKTRRAIEIMEEAGHTYAIVSGGNAFMDPYLGERGLIFDDARPDTGTGEFAWWLRVLDRYSFHCNIKHGGVSLKATTIIVTCPKSPEEFCEHWPGEDAKQLRRRITQVLHFSEVGKQSITV